MKDTIETATRQPVSPLRSKFSYYLSLLPVRIMLISSLIIFILLSSPVEYYENTNLTLHMFQHIGLFICAAIFGYGLDRLLIVRLAQLRRRFFIGWKAFTSVMKFNSRTKGIVFAVALPAVVFAYWHYPPNFDLAVTNLYVHSLEHLSYLIAGGFVGMSLMAIPPRWKAAFLFLAFMHMGMMGSIWLVWPSFFPVYSAAQNVEMDTAMMLFGALGVIGTSSWFLKMMNIV